MKRDVNKEELSKLLSDHKTRKLFAGTFMTLNFRLRDFSFIIVENLNLYFAENSTERRKLMEKSPFNPDGKFPPPRNSLFTI